MAVNAVEYLAALFVAIEALRDVMAQVAAGLAEADGQRMADRPAGSRAAAFVVAQETDEVTGGGETEPLHLGLGALIGEFVDESGPGCALGKFDRLAVDRS